MDAVALAATIGGSAVALAGLGVTAWGIKQQRESAQELEDSRQTHERALASGARLFEKRSDVYERMIGVLHVWTERVDSTEPMLRTGKEPEPPEPPGAEERRAMNSRLRTYGSKEVADGFESFVQSVSEFYGYADSLRTIRAQRGVALPWPELHTSREKVHADLRTIERLVSDELAKL